MSLGRAAAPSSIRTDPGRGITVPRSSTARAHPSPALTADRGAFALAWVLVNRRPFVLANRFAANTRDTLAGGGPLCRAARPRKKVAVAPPGSRVGAPTRPSDRGGIFVPRASAVRSPSVSGLPASRGWGIHPPRGPRASRSPSRPSARTLAGSWRSRAGAVHSSPAWPFGAGAAAESHPLDLLPPVRDERDPRLCTPPPALTLEARARDRVRWGDLGGSCLRPHEPSFLPRC